MFIDYIIITAFMDIIKYNFSNDIVLKLFIIIDDLVSAINKRLLPVKKAGRNHNLTPSEIITIALLFTLSNCKDFKHFYTFFDLHHYFPNIPSYERTLASIKTYGSMMLLILKAFMTINRKKADKLIKLIDSVPFPVCNNKRIFNYKVSNLADRGKSSMGWFYGFKLHVITDENGNLLNIVLSSGNKSDKDHEIVLSLVKDIQGILVGDAGYQSKPLTEKLGKIGITFITGLKKGTKQLVTLAYNNLKRLRQRIETAIGSIKHRQSSVSSLPRSTDGYFWRYLAACLAYAIMKAYS
jgi:hypothetical protein